MRYFYNRRLFISILFILLVVCTTFLPNNDFSLNHSDDKTPQFQLLRNNFSDVSIMIPKTPNKLSYNVNSDINSIFKIYETSKFVLALQLALQVLIIDRRKQIIALITSHFEGGKYKVALSIL